MQPCQVCGTADVDVNGYCVNCRTFRGMVHYEVITPAVSSVPPVPPAKRRRTAPLSLLIFTTAALLVVSTILIITVVMNDVGASARASADRSPSPKPSTSAAAPTPSASAAPAVLSGLDKCLIGTWSSTFDSVPIDDKTTLTTHAGPTLDFRGDGTMTFNYGSGVTYTGTVGKKKAQLLITGQVVFKYTTVNRALNLTGAVPDTRGVYIVDGVLQSNAQIPVPDQSLPYACNGENLTINPDTPDPFTARHQ